MIYLIGIIVLSVIAFIVAEIISDDGFCAFAISSIVCLLCIAASLITAYCIEDSNFENKHKTITDASYCYDLITLQDTKETSTQSHGEIRGNILYVAGSYDSNTNTDLYYEYFIHTSDGIVYEKVKAVNSLLDYIEENEKPYVKYNRTKVIYDEKFAFWFGYDTETYNWGKVVLYVPKNCIQITDYAIDLK